MAELGPNVISDFDGTLVRLAVPWNALRDTLGVTRIDDLWVPLHSEGWEIVTTAEIDAAGSSPPVEEVLRALDATVAIAILTSNAELAVRAFLARTPTLAAKVTAVVGRDALGGPKTDFDIFRAGYERCLESLGGPAAVSYIGDMTYELEFASRLGATAIDAHAITSEGA